MTASTVPSPGSSSRHRQGLTPSAGAARFYQRWIQPYLYVAPFFVIFAIFGLIPLIYAGWISLHDWDPIGENRFVGFDNYQRLLTEDPRLWNSVLNTVSIWALSTGPQLVLALLLAQLLNRSELRFKTMFRMAALVPNVTSILAVAIIFTSIFGRDFGLANWLLEVAGQARVDWRGDRWLSHLVIASMISWRWTGYNALIFLAAMQAIPNQLYEAAKIDGASSMRRFIHITVPQIRPTILFTVIVSTIGGLQVFAEPLVFSGERGTQGGSGRQFQTMTLFLYEQGFSRFNFGYAAAITLLLVFLIALLSLANFWLVRRINST